MPLPLPKSRPERPRRLVVPSEPKLRPPPVSTYSFDPNAARQAWRQVARTRGANAMRLDGRESGSRLAPLALGLVAIIGAAMWWMGGDEPDAAQSLAAEVASSDVQGDQDGSEPRAPSVDDPGNDGADRFAFMGGLAAPPEQPLPPPMPEGFDQPEPPLSAAAARALPADTLRQNAEVLHKLPHSPHDRPPIGGIGAEGLHIDRITMGTSYSDGACSGPVGKFSIRKDGATNVCFRAVHRRVKQTVIVLWERNGKLMRRTFVTIGDGHGYRTRAALNLRRKYAGQWTVRVMSSDGIELASQRFDVTE